MIFIALVRREVRQERHRPRLLDRVRQLALVPGTAARDAPGNDLASLADEAPETAHVLVVDEIDLVHAELADLPPAEPAALDGDRKSTRLNSSHLGISYAVFCLAQK